MNVLSVDGLTVTYRGRRQMTAVSDVKMSLARGESLAVVGESGSGKSTFVRAIGGLLSDRATVAYKQLTVNDVGLDSANRLPTLGRDVAYVFQEPQAHLNPSMRVGSQLMEVLRLQRGMSKKAAVAEATSLLTEVGIRDSRSSLRGYAHQFSGGQAQRIAIAIAIAAQPRLLIVDEPTSALDVTVAARILALLRRIQLERGMAMIHVTHNLHLAARTADRVAVMYAGQIVEVGAAGDVLSQPRMPYTQGLLQAVPAADGSRPQPIPGSLPDLRASIVGCRFAARCPYVREDCHEPVALRRMPDGHEARCVLVSDENAGARR